MAVEAETSCEFASPKFYALCGLGGIVSCGTTHTAIVPLDLVKCRLQVDKTKYGSLTRGFRVTFMEEGLRGLGRGWAPTFFGYSLQGLGKFGFYEIFKHTYSGMLSEVNFLDIIQACRKTPSFGGLLSTWLLALVLSSLLTSCFVPWKH